jgi:hypothetical protein
VDGFKNRCVVKRNRGAMASTDRRSSCKPNRVPRVTPAGRPIPPGVQVQVEDEAARRRGSMLISSGPATA